MQSSNARRSRLVAGATLVIAGVAATTWAWLHATQAQEWVLGFADVLIGAVVVGLIRLDRRNRRAETHDKKRSAPTA